MKRLLILLLIALVCFTASGCKRSGTPSTSLDNRLLALALTETFGREPFTVVQPETGVGPGAEAPEDLGRLRDYLIRQLNLQGVDTGKLVDGFIQKNRQSVRLTLPSAPKQGYVVDYEGKYTRYFEKDGGGWQPFLKDHPEVHGLTTVSLPYYDPASGIVLLYMGTVYAPLAGQGQVIAYKYDGQTLKEVGRGNVWIS